MADEWASLANMLGDLIIKYGDQLIDQDEKAAQSSPNIIMLPRKSQEEQPPDLRKTA